MSNENEKIIMYDSPEAGRLVTVTVWEVDNANGIIYTKNEHSARWNNCTHLKCECGGIRHKHFTICEDCRRQKAEERYLALPYKEWDGKHPLVERDGDKYFFSEDDLIDYMDDNEMDGIDLLLCDPVNYSQIDLQNVADETHENWEPEKELVDAIKSANEVIKKLPPHSWTPGKIRTSYKRPTP